MNTNMKIKEITEEYNIYYETVYACGHIELDDIYTEYNTIYEYKGYKTWTLYDITEDSDDYELEREEVVINDYHESKDNHICPACIRAKQIRNRNWFHGLQAFNKTKTKNINDSINRIIDIYANKWDICVSSSPIGPIGLRYKGKVDRYFYHDTYSYIDEFGNRMAGQENEFSDHDEGFINTQRKPYSIWLKEWYWNKIPENEKADIVLFAKEMSLLLEIVDSRNNR